MTGSKIEIPNDKPTNWWSIQPDKLIDRFKVDPAHGLGLESVAQSRDHFGSNQISERGPTNLWKLLWESITSPMMLVLLAIAGISLTLGQIREAVVMAVVVAIYVGVHLLNKARSDRTMAKLREVQAPQTTVLRGGEKREIDFEDVVVGDILPLRPGGRVPADARLISSAGLLVDESALTGESAPVRKMADADISSEIPLAERKTAVYAGTTLLDGQGKAIVMAVGEKTELGKVAALATTPELEKTPLQAEMEGLANTLAYVAIGVSLLIPLVGWLRGFDLEQMALTWLSLTFLMVPGQPPIIISMALALAALELAKKNVIVRRLFGAETLRSITLALSDKTGTLTENEMRLSGVLLPDGRLVNFDQPAADRQEIIDEFLKLALAAIPENTQDPTDLAILEAAEEQGLSSEISQDRLSEMQGFSSSGSYRSLNYTTDGEERQYVTGQPEVLLEHAERKYESSEQGDSFPQLTPGDRSALMETFGKLGSQGKRLAGYALHQGEMADEPDDLIFVGTAVITDPVRPEVPDAIRALEGAGVRTVMVTGDIPETAQQVGREASIYAESVLTGSELSEIHDESLGEKLQKISIFARTTPEQKLRLVKAFQEEGHTVAVTGDGINDAPALNAAHIGIAMGEKGTDVARESADLVLTDDNFAHLPEGVAIGRKAYDNFRKGITYYLSAKAILLAIFIVPLIFGVPFPFAPIQIIFTELLMDLASSTIFITEEAEPDILSRKPRQRRRFLSWEVGRQILRNMAGLTFAILAVYFGTLALKFPSDTARTAAFATWLLGHIILAMNLKQEQRPLFKQGLFSNTFAVLWLVGMIGFVLAMTQWPFAQSLLGTTGLNNTQWAMVVVGALLASMWMEVVKWIRIWRQERS